MDHFRYGNERQPWGANAHSFMLELVGHRKRVLEVGCSAGAITAALAEQDCEVIAVEIDPVTAERAREHAIDVLVDDVERVDLLARFGERSFDVVLLGDVLEHLRQPAEMLDTARRLIVGGGSVVASVPNVAHGDVRLALLEGRFEYRPVGLLDATHLHFFTAATLEETFRRAGLVPVEVRRVRLALGATEVEVQPDRFPADVLEAIRADPEAETYQFVVRAVLDDAGSAVRELHEREQRLGSEREAMERELGALRQELGALRQELGDLRAEHERTTEELEAVYATRLFRWSAPARGVYGGLRRMNERKAPPG